MTPSVRKVELSFRVFHFTQAVELTLAANERIVSVESNGSTRLVWVEREVEDA